MRKPLLGTLLAAAVLPTAACAAPASIPAYTLGTPIAGPDGGWDYASTDDAGTKVYIARGASVTVIDIATGAVSSLGAIARGHAVVPMPGGKLLVTSGTDDTVRLFDTATSTQTASIAVGKKPDAAILNPAKTMAVVMNAGDGTVSVIDLATVKVTRTISLAPGLEFAAFGGDGTVYINNERTNVIHTVDIATGMAGKPIAIPGCTAPSGLGYDGSHNRLIASCDNGKAAIVDLATKKLTALVDIGSGPDAVIMDDTRGLALIPCGESGELDVLSLAGNTVSHVGTVKTEVGARTGAVDPKTGTVYLPSARFGPPAKPGAWPTMIPGSFHVVVVHPS